MCDINFKLTIYYYIYFDSMSIKMNNSKSGHFGVTMKRMCTMSEDLIGQEGGLICTNSTSRDQLMGCTNLR